MALFDAPDDSLNELPPELQNVQGNKAQKLVKIISGGLPGAAAATGGGLFNSGVATPPQSTQVDPNAIAAPDVGQPANKFNLPWLPGYKPPQPQRPPMTTPTGQMVPGLTGKQKFQVLTGAALKGALAGRASSEQAVIASGGRRSGGAGMGFEAGFTEPARETMTQQQSSAAV